MPDFNLAILIGRLVRDPELKYLPSGQAVCGFTLAVNKRWTNKAGEKQEKVAFIDITAWGKTGELATEYLRKGSHALVQGSIEQESWEKDGQKRTKLKVTADRVQFLDPKVPFVIPESAEQAAPAAAAQEVPLPPASESDQEIPF